MENLLYFLLITIITLVTTHYLSALLNIFRMLLLVA
jgi:hypothetical protein